MPALVEELQYGDALGRELAALALGRLGTYADDAVEVLLTANQDLEVNVRRQAVIALGHIGAHPEAAIAGLRETVRDADSLVRDQAFIALGRQRQAGAVELASLLKDSDADVRRRAVIEARANGL